MRTSRFYVPFLSFVSSLLRYGSLQDSFSLHFFLSSKTFYTAFPKITQSLREIIFLCSSCMEVKNICEQKTIRNYASIYIDAFFYTFCTKTAIKTHSRYFVFCIYYILLALSSTNFDRNFRQWRWALTAFSCYFQRLVIC